MASSSYRQLEARLKRAGFVASEGRGSHRKWYHAPSGARVVLPANHRGEDAPAYQIRRVERLVKQALREGSASP